MNKDFAREFRAKLVKTHFLVLLAAMGGYFLLYILIITVFRDWVASILQSVLGNERAWALMQYQSLIVLVGFVLTVAVSWIIVEYRAMHRLVNTIGALETFFKNDDQQLVLDKGREFHKIEVELNAVKYESLKNEQRALMEVQRKNDLITYLAHDIKTPLTSVIGYLSLLDEIPEMPEVQRTKYTRITLEKAYRLEALVNEFFEITRFNLSTIPLEKKFVDLGLMLTQMADEFYPILEPQGKSAVVHMQEEDISIYVDPNKMARVFNNILKNAVAYSYPNTAIVIDANVKNDKVSIAFRNQGDRIPPEKLESIFEKFYRLDEARSTNTGGAGLGLAIAKEIVNAHGGRIEASSNARETVFTVMLPVSAS